MALAPFLGLRNGLFGMADPNFEAMVNILDHSPAMVSARDAQAMASTNVDWKETPTEHVFVVDLPGLRKEEIKVQVEDGRTLSISGQRSREEVQNSDTWHRVERSSGQFMRRFRLPEDTDLDHVAAKVVNGVLTVTVPKVETKSQSRRIEVGGSAGTQPHAMEQNGHSDDDTTEHDFPEVFIQLPCREKEMPCITCTKKSSAVAKSSHNEPLETGQRESIFFKQSPKTSTKSYSNFSALFWQKT